MSEYYSTLSGWMIPVSSAMEANGILFSDAEITCKIALGDFEYQESRLAVKQLTMLVDYCNTRLPKKDFSVQINEHFHPGIFHTLGYAMLSSDTFVDALHLIANYKRVLSNTCSLNIQESGKELQFNMNIHVCAETNRPVIEHIGVEVFLTTIVQIARRMLGGNFAPLKVYFTAPLPKHDITYLEQYFSCPIEFSAAFNGILFDAESARRKLLCGNPLITQAHEKMLDEFMSRIDVDDLTHVIKNKIYDLLTLGAPTQTTIASQLGMSLRNLQRRLHEQGTSYKEILEQTRKNLSLNYILQPHLTLGEIGYLVGFSSVGNFNRAFKRWSGLAPGQYRAERGCGNLVRDPTSHTISDFAPASKA
jgi:AraC-like DNA-binding protein